MELSQVMVKFLLFVFWLLWLTTCSSSTSKRCSSYTFSSEPKNWEESNKYCEQDKGHLVSMETEQEYEFINKTIQGRDERDDEWYIGLRNNEKTREKIKGWKWISGHKLTIDKWFPGQPTGNGKCVKMLKNYTGSYGLFDDLTCNSEKRMFICEYNVSLEIAGQTDTFCSDINYHAEKPIPRPTSSIQRSTTKTITAATTKTTTLITTTTTPTPTTTAASTTTAKTLTKTKEMVIRNGKWTKSSPSTGLYITSVPNTTIPVVGVPHPFPIMVVVIVLAILLVISICTFSIAFFWLRKKSRSKEQNERAHRKKSTSTTQMESAKCQTNHNHLSSMSGAVQIVGTDTVLYAVQHDVGYPGVPTYAEVYDAIEAPQGAPIYDKENQYLEPIDATSPSLNTNLQHGTTGLNPKPYQAVNKSSEHGSDVPISAKKNMLQHGTTGLNPKPCQATKKSSGHDSNVPISAKENMLQHGSTGLSQKPCQAMNNSSGLGNSVPISAKENTLYEPHNEKKNNLQPAGHTVPSSYTSLYATTDLNLKAYNAVDKSSGQNSIVSASEKKDNFCEGEFEQFSNDMKNRPFSQTSLYAITDII